MIMITTVVWALLATVAITTVGKSYNCSRRIRTMLNDCHYKLYTVRYLDRGYM